MIRSFRWALLGWFWRLPWGLGLATLRACLRLSVGLSRSGVRSAGNGAAMRSAVIGVWLADDSQRRAALTRSLAQVTHVDERAVQAAVFVAEVAARLSTQAAGRPSVDELRQAVTVVNQIELHAALTRALDRAAAGAAPEAAAAELGVTGYSVHSVAWATFCMARYGGNPLTAVQVAIGAGGDTDTTAAMVGAWAGALHGESGLPSTLLTGLAGGPFGPAHLRALARNLAAPESGLTVRYLWPLAMLRNLALYPVILAHGFRRLWPW